MASFFHEAKINCGWWHFPLRGVGTRDFLEKAEMLIDAMGLSHGEEAQAKGQVDWQTEHCIQKGWAETASEVGRQIKTSSTGRKDKSQKSSSA
jgi:hypothetical protein